MDVLLKHKQMTEPDSFVLHTQTNDVQVDINQTFKSTGTHIREMKHSQTLNNKHI